MHTMFAPYSAFSTHLALLMPATSAALVCCMSDAYILSCHQEAVDSAELRCRVRRMIRSDDTDECQRETGLDVVRSSVHLRLMGCIAGELHAAHVPLTDAVAANSALRAVERHGRLHGARLLLHRLCAHRH